MLILCRADSQTEIGASHPSATTQCADPSHSIEVGENTIVTQFSRRRPGETAKKEQGVQCESEQALIVELQERISELDRAKDAAEARAEHIETQNKVDIKWYENQLRALEEDSFQLSLVRSKGHAEFVSSKSLARL